MSLFEGGRGREFDLSRRSEENDVDGDRFARQVGGSSQESPDTFSPLDPTSGADKSPQKSPTERMAAALDGLLTCLVEFGPEAHLYCGEWVQDGQAALTEYQQSVCSHSPQRIPGMDGKWCVLCGLRIIEDNAIFHGEY